MQRRVFRREAHLHVAVERIFECRRTGKRYGLTGQNLHLVRTGAHARQQAVDKSQKGHGQQQGADLAHKALPLAGLPTGVPERCAEL